MTDDLDHSLLQAGAAFLGSQTAAAAMLPEVKARLAYHRGRARKECLTCHQHLPLTAFAANAGRPDGITNSCMDCILDREENA